MIKTGSDWATRFDAVERFEACFNATRGGSYIPGVGWEYPQCRAELCNDLAREYPKPFTFNMVPATVQVVCKNVRSDDVAKVKQALFEQIVPPYIEVSREGYAMYAETDSYRADLYRAPLMRVLIPQAKTIWMSHRAYCGYTTGEIEHFAHMFGLPNASCPTWEAAECSEDAIWQPLTFNALQKASPSASYTFHVNQMNWTRTGEKEGACRVPQPPHTYFSKDAFDVAENGARIWGDLVDHGMPDFGNQCAWLEEYYNFKVVTENYLSALLNDVRESDQA